jgi:hypothetical protein
VRWPAGAILRAGPVPAPAALAVHCAHDGERHDEDPQEDGERLSHVVEHQHTDDGDERSECERERKTTP